MWKSRNCNWFGWICQVKNGAFGTDENNCLARFVQFVKKKELKEQSDKQSKTKRDNTGRQIWLKRYFK